MEVPLSDGPGSENAKREITLSSLGPLKDSEERDPNCAVKEYLLFAGYRLTAMTFNLLLRRSSVSTLSFPLSLPNFKHRKDI